MFKRNTRNDAQQLCLGKLSEPAQRRHRPSLVVISGLGLPRKETISLEMQKSEKKIQLGLHTEAKSIKEKMGAAPRTSRYQLTGGRDGLENVLHLCSCSVT